MPASTAHIVQRMSPGGLEVVALRLARELPGKHIVVSLEGATGELIQAWPRLLALGGALHGLDKRDGLAPALVARLARLLRAHAINRVMTHHAGPLIYGGLAARLAGVTRVVHVEHDTWHFRAARRGRLMRNAARVSRARIVGVSERMRAPLASVYRGAAITIIPNGVDLPEGVVDRFTSRAALGLAPDTVVIGAAGRLEWVKGHDILIDALSRLPDNVQLLIAGDGSRRDDLARQIRVSRLESRARLLGHRDDMADLFPAFDVFCQPSRDEGLPLAILEAQAAGCPVVATRVGDVETAVCPQSGALAPAENAATLAEAITRLLHSPARPSPRAFVAARFDWNTTLEGYANILGV